MTPAAEASKFVELITRPLRDENFRRLVTFFGSWNFAIALAAPFSLSTCCNDSATVCRSSSR